MWSHPPTQQQIEEMEPRFHKMAAAFAKCEADRLDYVQAAFMALLKPTKMKNVMACAYYAMIDYYRSQNRAKMRHGVNIELTGDYQFEGEPFGYVEQDILEDEDFRSLDWLNIPLTKAQKQTVLLYWMEGYTQFEVAKKVGVSQDTISRWLTEIKNKVKDNLKGV